MAQPTAQQRTIFWIISIGLIIALGYIVFLLAQPGSPLRSEASGPIRAAGQQPYLIRSGVVSSVSDNEITVSEKDGSFTVKTDVAIIRTVNANNLFEISSKDQLSDGDEVIVRYLESESGVTVESIDIVKNQ
ncbi:hypothetical protein KC644_00490 [Candidatus Berkelbacteria bacterium]|nr:hypothetical protein [Candidatus Berkelbacteria bacterium]